MKSKNLNYLFILVGIVLIAYPFVSNLIGRYHQTEVISQYQKQIDNLTDEEKDEQLKNATEYNNNLINKREERIYNSYANLLNIGEVIAYIDIPKINVHLPIYHGVSENVLQSGVGHMKGSSLPVGGVGTHAVLSGHNGLVQTKIFDDINQLELGDKFFIHVLDQTLAYQVDDIRVVLPNEVDSIQIDENEDYVTLVTCTPYMINTHRLLVRGTRISLDEVPEEESITNNNYNVEKEKSKLKVSMRIVKAITLCVIILILMWILFKRNDKHKPKHLKERRADENNQ